MNCRAVWQRWKLRKFARRLVALFAAQVLFEIEDSPYRAALAQAQGALARAQATIGSTSLQAQRFKDLVGINAVSRQEYDNAVVLVQNTPPIYPPGQPAPRHK